MSFQYGDVWLSCDSNYMYCFCVLLNFKHFCLESFAFAVQGASEKDIVHSGLAQTMEGIALVR